MVQKENLGLLTPKERNLINALQRYGSISKIPRDRSPLRKKPEYPETLAARYAMLYRIRQKVKGTFDDLTLLAEKLPEEQQRQIFPVGSFSKLIETVLSGDRDFSSWSIIDLTKHDRQFRLAREIGTTALRIENRLRRPLDKSERNQPDFLAFEKALIMAGLVDDYDAKRFLDDAQYRAELWHKLQAKSRKDRGDKNYYFDRAKKEEKIIG